MSSKSSSLPSSDLFRTRLKPKVIGVEKTNVMFPRELGGSTGEVASDFLEVDWLNTFAPNKFGGGAE